MTSKTNRPTAKAVPLAALCAATVLLAGCGSGTTAGSTTSPATTGNTVTTGGPVTGTAPVTGGEVTIADTWVRATDGTQDPSMTAAFGVLTNHTGDQLTVVSATNNVSDHTELHEMVTENGAMVMRPVAGGITIPAGGSTTLEPGGLHVMLLDLTGPIKPGDEVDVTLTLDDGSTLPFTAVAKEFAGANESYSPDTDTDTDTDTDMDMGTGTGTGTGIDGAMDPGSAMSSHG